MNSIGAVALFFTFAFACGWTWRSCQSDRQRKKDLLFFEQHIKELKAASAQVDRMIAANSREIKFARVKITDETDA